MKRTYKILSALLLAFLLSVPVFAQEATQTVDATPTVEATVTEVAAPVSEPVTDVHNALDDIIEFLSTLLSNPTMYLGLGLLFAVVKIKQPQTKAEYEAEKQDIARQREVAKKTETKADDVIAELRNLVNEFRGVHSATAPNPVPTTPTPPMPQPTTAVSTPSGDIPTITITPNVTTYPAIQTTEFLDEFGIRGDNGYTWTGKGHDPAVIEIPVGYDYIVDNHDGNRDPQPVKAVNTNAEYGTRLNVSFVAGKHLFTRKQRVELGTGLHEITLSYEADVKSKESAPPMYNWLWVEAFIDGQPVLTGTEAVNHRALENGAHVATWIFNNALPRTVTLSFQVVVHWASAESFSVIDLRAFGLKQAG